MGKDIQNKLGTINHPEISKIGDRPDLGRIEFLVENKQVGIESQGGNDNLGEFPTPQDKAGIDFIAALQQLVRYLEISDGNMEEGSMRCDVNVSVMPKVSDSYVERNEIKNVNSKKFAKIAVDYESKRQIKLLEKGETITKNTLLFNPDTGTTKPMRTKEEANDYRYFPDPDLPPLQLTQAYVDEITEKIELLPWTAQKLLIFH